MCRAAARGLMLGAMKALKSDLPKSNGAESSYYDYWKRITI
jgi:hypothetical protein